MRRGEYLLPMTQDMLRRVFEEVGPDFSAQVCTGASLVDLDPTTIQRLRDMWSRRASNQSLLQASADQLLSDARFSDGQRRYLCGASAPRYTHFVGQVPGAGRGRLRVPFRGRRWPRSAES